MEKYIIINGNKERLIPFFNIDVEYFKNEFIIDKEKFADQYKIYRNAFNWIRRSYTYYLLFNEYYADTITLYGNEMNLNRSITFSFEEFLLKLRDYLSINTSFSIYDPIFIEAAKRNINILKSIKKEEDLKMKFPKLYDIFINANKVDKFESGTYYDYGLRPTPDAFIEEQTVYFEHVFKNLDKIENEYASYNIVRDAIKGNYYRDKFRLYTAYKLFSLLSNSETKDRIPGIENVLKKYFDDINDISDINVSIKLENGDRISFLELLSDYNRLYNNETLDLWDILPQGHDSTKEFHPPLQAMSDEEYMRLYNLNIEKYNFYESLKYLRKGKGKYLNTGYYAFFFSNGQQILDKLCYPGEDFIVSHYGNAIYNLNIRNFELLSRINKTKIRHDRLCPFTTHNGNWQDRVRIMIDSVPTTSESVEKTCELIKKIEKKK